MSSLSFELKDEVVRAGAGAGKTTTLTRKIGEFIYEFRNNHGRFPKIVVTTFTKKATQELKERLLLKALEDKDYVLVDYYSEGSGVFISTIHGVLHNFLQTYGYLAGVESGFEIISEPKKIYLYKRIINKMLDEHSDVFDELTDSYSYDQIIQILSLFREKNFSGFDFATEKDFLNLFRVKIDVWIVRTNNLIDLLVSQYPNEKWQSYAEGLRSILQSSLNQADQSYLDRIKDLPSKPRKVKDTPELVAEELKEIDQFVKKVLPEPYFNQDFWLNHQTLVKSFQKFYTLFNKELTEYKSELSVLEMSDLELKTIDIIKNMPHLARLYSANWDYWMVDEFQDTSPIQVEILDNLIGESSAFVVGDPQQSIYLFRGARSEVFKQKEVIVKKKGGELSFLQKNYRSRPETLVFFNDFFEKVGSQFSSMEPREEKFNPEFVAGEIAALPICDEKGKSKNTFEFNYITCKILELVSRGVQFDEICVLSRTNSYLLKLAQALKNSGIPYNLCSPGGFSSRRVTLDALSFLKFLVNPNDNLNVINLLRSPWFFVSDQLMTDTFKGKVEHFWSFALANLAEHEAISALQQALLSCKEVGITIAFRDTLISRGFVDATREYDPTGRRESNFWKLIAKLSDAERKQGFNYNEFIDQLFSGSDKDLLSGEGEAVAALEPNCINLMTVHGSKGLQFKHVFVPQMNKKPKTMLTSSSKDHLTVDDQLEKWALFAKDETGRLARTLLHQKNFEEGHEKETLENQRLLYVALTRSSEQVYLSTSGKIETDSWADLVPYFEMEAGVYKKEKYSFSVVQSFEEKPGGYSPENKKSKALTLDQPSLEYITLPSIYKKVSVSEILSQTEVTAGKEVFGFSKPTNLFEGIKKTAEGSLMHLLFEKLQDFSVAEVERYIESRFSGKLLEKMKNSIGYINSIQEPDLMSIIKNGQAEWGFQLVTDQGLIEGQIDLWGEFEGVNWIVDYKTGSEKYKSKAFEQLKYYSQAVQKISSRPIALAVVYPFSQKIFTEKI